MNRNRLNMESMIIKAKCTNHGETTARKVLITKDVKLEELEFKLRERFDIGYDKSLVLYYIDEDKDRVAVSFEDELALALDNSKIPTFEVVVKPKIIDNMFTYPQVSKGKPGDCAEVLIESQYLTLSHAMSDDTKAWGTIAYTDDSDIVKVLAHSEKMELPDDPPLYNVIATIRFIPGCLKYIGTSSRGITTMNYGPYESSYIIENVRTAPIINEKAFYSSLE